MPLVGCGDWREWMAKIADPDGKTMAYRPWPPDGKVNDFRCEEVSPVPDIQKVSSAHRCILQVDHEIPIQDRLGTKHVDKFGNEWW